MSDSGWWERHGAVFTSIITLVSVLTYLHVSLNTLRDDIRGEIGSLRTEMGSLRTEFGAETGSLRTETGSLRTELRTEMSSLRTEIRAEIKDLRASLDRVEAKVDEVRGYLRFNASVPQDELLPKE
ncbi:MAG: hypothetical protein OXH02_14985 [Gemmatimonadetes bacterium]|nr:hypothetical protein [Gemmatimonadota bacterium]